MRYIGCIIFGLLTTNFAIAQTISIQAGSSISQIDIKWDNRLYELYPLYEKKLISHAFFIGVEYLGNQYYNLSTNLGLVKKGGKNETEAVDEYGNFTGEILIDKAKLEYISSNTIIEFKYPTKFNLSPFVGIGPRIDYLLNSSHHFYENNKITAGLIFGGGIKYFLNKTYIGIRSDYYWDFTKTPCWKPGYLRGTSETTLRTCTINLTLGIKIQ